MKKVLLFLAVFAAVSCAAASAGDPSDIPKSAQALTAEDRGLELMLPFPPDSPRTLTQAYDGPTSTSHRRYGPAQWDDSYALDFADDGCDSWNTPVLAAEDGIVRTLPAGIAPGSPDADAYEHSYGDRSVVIDHGDGCFSQYAHLESRAVTDGQRVARGQEIGREGNRGNVDGTTCPDHPGTHLHFKVWCEQDAIVPEPISGYHGLQGFVGKRFRHRALHHPPGTLVKEPGSPDIYRVEDDRRLRRVANETVWRSYRFFQDKAREWDTVVPVSHDELVCHDRAPDLSAPATLVATTCRGTTVFVAFEGGGVRWNKRVPFEANQAGYRVLLRSWGFSPTDVRKDDAWACGIPVVRDDDRLPLRDGTVIEQASDDDFYVIADDGTAYRLRRALMRVLYGDGWPQIIQVPDGSVPSLVRRMDPANREFTLADMTACATRRVTLETGLADGAGGGSPQETYGQTKPRAPTPAPTPAPPPAPSPTPNPEPPTSPTPSGPVIRCTRYGTTFALEVSGPVGDALVGIHLANIARIEIGSDRYGWSDADIGWSWQGDMAYRRSYPVDLGRFNLYAVAPDGTVGWFDLPDADHDGNAFVIEGDCHMVCTTDSCAIALR